MSAINNYKVAATEAGFTEHDDVIYAYEFPTHFDIIVYDDNEEEYMVSEFIKGHGEQHGDYPGCPLFTGTKRDCYQYVNDHHMKVLISRHSA